MKAFQATFEMTIIKIFFFEFATNPIEFKLPVSHSPVDITQKQYLFHTLFCRNTFCRKVISGFHFHYGKANSDLQYSFPVVSTSPRMEVYSELPSKCWMSVLEMCKGYHTTLCLTTLSYFGLTTIQILEMVIFFPFNLGFSNTTLQLLLVLLFIGACLKE